MFWSITFFFTLIGKHHLLKGVFRRWILKLGKERYFLIVSKQFNELFYFFGSSSSIQFQADGSSYSRYHRNYYIYQQCFAYVRYIFESGLRKTGYLLHRAFLIPSRSYLGVWFRWNNFYDYFVCCCLDAIILIFSKYSYFPKYFSLVIHKEKVLNLPFVLFIIINSFIEGGG